MSLLYVCFSYQFVGEKISKVCFKAFLMMFLLKTITKVQKVYRFLFLTPLAECLWAYVMVWCLSCIYYLYATVIFPSSTLKLSSNFDRNSQKSSNHGPLQKLLKEFDSFKNTGCHVNKTLKYCKSLKIFLSETIRPRGTKFGM